MLVICCFPTNACHTGYALSMNLHGGYMLDLAWLLKSWCFHFTIAPSCLLDPELGEHHFLRTASNIRIHYVAKGDTGQPLMLCIHGFPEVMYTCFYYFVIFTVIAADVFVNQIKHEILLTKFTIPALREKKTHWEDSFCNIFK